MAVALGAHVEWHAPFFSGGGYCSEATTFVLALDGLVDTSIVHHGDSVSEAYVRQLEPDVLARLRSLSSQRAADVVVCHSEPGAWHVLDGPSWPSSRCPTSAVAVGRTMFETDRLPDGWARRLNAMDEVWVPTEFHRRVFERAGVERLWVVGQGVDVDRFKPQGPKFDLRTDKFVALAVFKWEKRKAWDVLLRAWHRACSHDNALLVLVTSAYHSDSAFRDKLELFVKENLGVDLDSLCPVRVVSSLPQRDLEALYRTADVLLAPSRGEGWGRPHVEAMASGTPIIATNWSGPTAYLTELNGYPLKTRDDLVLVGDDGPFKDHRWAEPDLDHFVQLIEQAIDDPHDRARKGERARQDMVDFFSPRTLALQVAARLDFLANNATLRRESKQRRRRPRTSTAKTSPSPPDEL